MKSRTCTETVGLAKDRVGSAAPADGPKMLLLCAGCDGPILDRFLLNVLDRVWHVKCVQCSECRCMLVDKCFSRDGRLYCREDFFMRFGTKCGGCGQGISPNDLVRRARQSVYHLKCFTCSVCHRQLSTGEQLYVVDDTQFICKDDFISSKLHTGYSDVTDADADGPLQDKLDETFSDHDVSSPSAVARPSSCFNDDSPPTIPFPPTSMRPTLPVGDSRNATCPPTATGLRLPVTGGGTAAGLQSNGVAAEWPGGGMVVVTGSDVICAGDDCSLDSSSSCGEDTNGSLAGGVNNNNNGEKTVGRGDKEGKGDGAGSDGTPAGGAAGAKRRGPRTTIKAKQLETLKSAFAATPKPTRHIREQLAQETGLNMRVIQVWFQNRRSKERRMKQLSAMGARRQFFRNPRRLRTLRPGDEYADTVDLLGSAALGYFPDNCEFYPGYPGFSDYFAAVHHGAADQGGLGFLSPPTSGPHVGQPIGDHVAPQLHDGMFLPPELVLQQSSQQQQARSSPDQLVDSHHFAAGGAPSGLPTQQLFGHHAELQMTESW